MADRREMLARLNPHTVRLNVGQGGGAPRLTTSDIAAALGMVPAGLGREMMEAVYLPDGALRHRPKLAEAVLAIVRPEFTRRARALADADAELEFVQAIVLLGRRGMSDVQRRPLQQRKAAADQARAAAWPAAHTSTSARCSTPWCRSWPAATTAPTAAAPVWSARRGAPKAAAPALSLFRTDVVLSRGNGSE